MLTALIAILPIVAGALVELHGEHLQRRAEDPTITLNVGAGVKFLKMSVVYSNEGDRLSWPFIDVSKWPQESPSQWQVQLPPMLDDINRSIDEGPLEGWKRIHVAWRATIGGTEYMTKSVEYRFGVDKNFFRDQVLASQHREILPVAGKGDNSELKYSCKQAV